MNWKSVLTLALTIVLGASIGFAQSEPQPPVDSPQPAPPAAEVQKFTDMMQAAGQMIAGLKQQHDKAAAARAADPTIPPRPLRDPKVSVMLVTGGAASGAAIGAAITQDARGAALGAVAGAVAAIVYDRMTYRSPGQN